MPSCSAPRSTSTHISGVGYRVEDHRGRARVHYQTPFGDVGNLTTKLDIGPAPWLPSDQRGWVRLAIHEAYQLPASIPVMALEENMAEKVARLTRRTPARDVYDLVWIASTSPHSTFDRIAVRRLSILKNWVDRYGMSSPPATWQPVSGATPYDPGSWVRIRRAADFDDDSIGALAVPAPSLDELGTRLHSLYGFLAEPDELELKRRRRRQPPSRPRRDQHAARQPLRRTPAALTDETLGRDRAAPDRSTLRGMSAHCVDEADRDSPCW